jgi:hypothetical protein
MEAKKEIQKYIEDECEVEDEEISENEEEIEEGYEKSFIDDEVIDEEPPREMLIPKFEDKKSPKKVLKKKRKFEEEEFNPHTSKDKKSGKFKLKAQNLFLTYPRCNIKKEDVFLYLKNLLNSWNFDIIKYVIAHEVHKKENENLPMDHIHCYIELDRKINRNGCDLLDLKNGNEVYHGYYVPCRNKWAVINYCRKDNDFISNIPNKDVQIANKARRNHRKIICHKLITRQITLVEAVQEDPMLIFQYKKLKDNLNQYYMDTLEIPRVIMRKNYWIYGDYELGKSKFVNDLVNIGNLYRKNPNKWWDNYKNENCVILEDIDHENAKYLSYYLKIWGDIYPFRAEVKGSDIIPLYKHFFVTSNYKIEEIYKPENDEQLYGAIKRRFKEVTIKNGKLYDEHLNNFIVHEDFNLGK